METVIEFFNYILDAMHELPNTTDSYWERIVMWLMIVYFEIKLVAIEFSYGIASSILSALNLSDLISDGWSSINSDILGVLTYLRVPESINMILSAFLTRFILGLLP